jgi:apolipoprotein N-acyltransferase
MTFSATRWSTSTALSICSGFLIALAFPQFELGGVAWVGLVPLLFAIDRKPLSRVFAYSWLQGFAFFLAVLYPIPIALIRFSHEVLTIALVKLLLLSGLEALSVGGAMSIGELISRHLNVPRTATLPISWVSFEFLRTYLPVGFPWGLLGYAAYRDVNLIQFAEFTGIYGISGLIVLVNVTVYDTLRHSYRPKAAVLKAAPALGAIGIALLFGTLRINQLRATPSAGRLTVALVQGNVPQSLKWNPSDLARNFQVYAEATLLAARQHPDLVIWPETAATFFFMPESEYTDQGLSIHAAYRKLLLTLIRNTHQPILFGALALDFDGEVSTRNRADLLSADGELVGYYDKMILVPFDEYVPMPHLLGRFIDKPVESIGRITAGTHQPLLPVKDAKLGVLICYESIFPSLARNSVRAGANVLVNLSNDAWFGTTSAPYQLLAMAAMRALENHTVMVRVANTGISAIVNPVGEIVSPTKLDTRVTETENISWISSRTFYTEHGDVFAMACAAITAIGSLVALVFRTAK